MSFARPVRSQDPRSRPLLSQPVGALLATALLAVAPVRAEGAEEADPLLGGPLVVDGEAVPADELRLHLIHSVGGGVLERVWMRWMVEAELTERAHRHAVHSATGGGEGDRDTFERTYARLLAALEASEEELAEEVDFQRSFLHWRNAGLDPETAIRRDHGSAAEFREHVRATMLFDRVFLPDDPETWPRVTVEAFLADPTGGQLLIDDARESYLTRLRLGEEYGDDPPRDDESLRRLYRDIVKRSLTSWLDVRTSVDGLRAPLVATVDFDADGAPEERLTIDDVWPEVRRLVDDEDVRLARRWLATTWATRSRLLESGLGPEAELRRLAELALRTRDDGRRSQEWSEEFPSLEIAYEYLWLREGVRRAYARELASLGTVVALDAGGGPQARAARAGTPAARPAPEQERPATREVVPEGLADAVWRVRSAAGRAEVDAELLLLAAWDEETSTWKDDGWACAKERAEALAAELKRKTDIHRLQVRRFHQVTVPEPDTLWSLALDEHSEFWEPSPARTAGGDDAARRTAPLRRSAPALRNGRFGSRGFDELRSMLRVSGYRRFAQGGSIADDVMFHLPLERIAGPLRGPLGYYLVRVLGRTEPERDLDTAQWTDAVLDELTLDYARGAVEAAEISGLD